MRTKRLPPRSRIGFDADSIMSYLLISTGESPKVLVNIHGREYTLYAVNVFGAHYIADELKAILTNDEGVELKYFEKI